MDMSPGRIREDRRHLSQCVTQSFSAVRTFSELELIDLIRGNLAVDLPKVGKEFKGADKVKLTFQSFRVSAGTASKAGFFSSLIAFLRALTFLICAISTVKT
jgi:hypothetical protein